MGMIPREVQVHIEELVLHGFSAADAPGIGAAVERELARLFAERGVPAALSGAAARDAVDAGAFEGSPERPAPDLGAKVAQSVYGGLSATEKTSR
jgi:hypothetical protein